MIPFNKPSFIGNEFDFLKQAIEIELKTSGDGIFTEECSTWIKNTTSTEKVLLTTSCTHALEMAAILIDIKPGDEVIMPSFTFVSTANPFVLRGARIVFVDIRPDTMNINEMLIESAITEKTKAIVPVHYAGVSCEMDQIIELAHKYHLYVIEDAAQGIMSKYKGRSLGAIGNFGCYSFHETKNFSMGEGGALLINNKQDIERAEIIREKGTNRSKFFRGEVDKYTWVDIGSSYLPSELNVAYLYAQFQKFEIIQQRRNEIWEIYYRNLIPLQKCGYIELPYIPNECEINGHIFYIKTKNLDERNKLIIFLKLNNIMAVFHYVPLHSSPQGKKSGRFVGKDVYTTNESNKLLRLPIFFNLSNNELIYIIDKIYEYYSFKSIEK